MGYRLHHGDCAKVLREYEDRADLILTSPPYDKLREYGDHGFEFDAVADACVAALKEGGVLVWVVADATIDGGETGTSFRQALGFMERGLRLHDTMIHVRKTLNNVTKVRYPQSFEYAFVFALGRPRAVNLIADRPNTERRRPVYQPLGRTPNGDRAHVGRKPRVTGPIGLRSNVWPYMTGARHSAPDYPAAHQHPAILTLALARDHIRTWTNPGDLVIDPMAGSGTTLRAAVDLQRRAVGIEIHEPYVRLIEGRMAQRVLL